MDTAALLGGNEYLISQMMDKLSGTPYSDDEAAAVKWAVERFYPAGKGMRSLHGTLAEHEGRLSQGHLTELFNPYNRERLTSTPSELATSKFGSVDDNFP